MKKFFLLFVFIFVHVLYSEQEIKIEIISKPIKYNNLRKKLTKEYSLLHYGKVILKIDPKIIVIHYTAENNFNKSFNEMFNEEIKGRKYLKKNGALNVSAHYLVSHDGKIYNILDDKLMGRHVIGLNHCAIGIENVGNNNLSKQQLLSNIKLVRYLVQKYPSIEYLIGHYEYRKFENTPLFVEKFKNYRTIKIDPGKNFMKNLRSNLNDLNLKSKWENAN